MTRRSATTAAERLRGYLAFLWRHRRFLGFGALLAGSSSFGQTWFVSLFGAEIREAFGLGHAGFGAVYSLATVASGVLLLWVGRLIDRLSLRRYTASRPVVNISDEFADDVALGVPIADDGLLGPD